MRFQISGGAYVETDRSGCRDVSGLYRKSSPLRRAIMTMIIIITCFRRTLQIDIKRSGKILKPV